jgi:hypothetical protein
MPSITKTEAKQKGIPKKTLQTILFDDNIFNVNSAKAWLKKHNYSNAYWRRTANQIRFMQTPPIKNSKYYSKKVDKEGTITFVFQDYS